MNKVLITGCAGFIGFHLTRRLIKEGFKVFGIDNLNNYYDVSLKEARLKQLNQISQEIYDSKWQFYKGNIEDNDFLNSTFQIVKPDIIFHFAAQAGVRFSIKNPQAYINSNLKGFGNIIECCRKFNIKNFIFASSSSVYGGNQKLPFAEIDQVNHPVSLYAATKKANELMAHSYSHLYSIPTIGLRFFTVYGPWGRPDMAPMLFTKSIINNKPLTVFNYGNMARDFTYIDDVIEIMIRLIYKPALKNDLFNKMMPDPSTSWSPYRIFNIGNSNKIQLLDFISEIEKNLKIKAIKNFEKMQKGDVKETFSDSKLIEEWTGYKPNTSIEVGVKKFVDWYKLFYN